MAVVKVMASSQTPQQTFVRVQSCRACIIKLLNVAAAMHQFAHSSSPVRAVPVLPDSFNCAVTGGMQAGRMVYFPAARRLA
jgi:hypothetical protein